MKAVFLFAAAGLVALSFNAQAGDVQAGALKAQNCVSCHGSASFPGIFPLVQLAGRDADKLSTKTNKYRTGKLFSPLMTMSVLGLKDQDVEDISAYYQSLGKPFMPMNGIRGDEDIRTSSK